MRRQATPEDIDEIIHTAQSEAVEGRERESSGDPRQREGGWGHIGKYEPASMGVEPETEPLQKQPTPEPPTCVTSSESLVTGIIGEIANAVCFGMTEKTSPMFQNTHL